MVTRARPFVNVIHDLPFFIHTLEFGRNRVLLEIQPPRSIKFQPIITDGHEKFLECQLTDMKRVMNKILTQVDFVVHKFHVDYPGRKPVTSR